MNKEAFVKHRRLIVTMFVIVVVIGLTIPFAGSIKNAFVGVADRIRYGDPTRIVGVVNGDKDILLMDLPNETYILYYEDENGVIEDYQGITIENLHYEGFVEENIAPAEAKKIGVYDMKGQRRGFILLGSLAAPDLGVKLYSNATISDIHLPAATGASDFQKALTYFNGLDDVLFVNVCGDLTDVGSAEELTDYKEMRDMYSSKPVYAVSGNHEYTCSTSYDSSNWTAYTGHNLWYSYTQGDDVYIMVGMNGSARPFSTSELQWLYETLEANRNKRCFVYQHVFPWSGSGDVAGLNGHGDMLDNVPGQVFLSLMSHYKNVVWFHGHSHQKFQTQERYSMNNIDCIYGRYSVHVPSLALPRVVEGDAQRDVHEASEGYIVDVYENGIILRGRDFIDEKFVPIATFYLDTTLRSIEAEAYCDPTGTILNENTPEFTSLPDGTKYLMNQRYSESGGGIIDDNGYVTFVIPCIGDGTASYALQIKNTGLDITKKQSTFILLDSNQEYIGTTNGSKFFCEMSGVATLENGTVQVKFVPSDQTTYIMISIAVKSDIPISIFDFNDCVVSLDEISVTLTLPSDTVYMMNQRYSESGGVIVDAKGFVTFMVPCVGDGETSYVLQLQNTNLDITKRQSTFFLFDANQNYIGTTNGSKFFCEMSGVTTLGDDTIQVNFTPSHETAYIVISIDENTNNTISILDISDYVITLT